MDPKLLLLNRKGLAVLCFLTASLWGYSQGVDSTDSSVKPEKVHSDHYYKRLSLFEAEEDTPGEIIFLGNSITEGGDWKALFPGKNVVNRGISGDVTDGILDRIGEVTASQPSKVFLLVGTNDMARDKSVDHVVSGIRAIILEIQERSEHTQIYLQSILPVNPGVGTRFAGHKANQQKIIEANARLKDLAGERNITFVDLHKAMRDRKGLLKEKYTHDGLHLREKGYVRWKQAIKRYVE